MLIADGRRAIVGGSNYGTRYLAAGQWRDTNMLLTGPVVTTIQQDFLNDWQTMGGVNVQASPALPELEPTGDLSIRYIEQRPAQSDFDVNTALLISLRLAEEYVLIEAPYFNPTDWLIEELIAVADRGVEVHILTNSAESVDIQALFPVISSWFETLLNHGIHVLLWDFGERTMHSKAIVVDDKLAMVGTHNFNARSILWDSEDMVVFTDADAVLQVFQMIQDDCEAPHVHEIDFEWLDTHQVGSRGCLAWPVLLGPLF
jgi:cardiolipin synthase